MIMIEISREGIERSKFLGRGVVGGAYVADLWELEGGLVGALMPGTHVLSRNPLASQAEWRRCEDYWIPVGKDDE